MVGADGKAREVSSKRRQPAPPGPAKTARSPRHPLYFVVNSSRGTIKVQKWANFYTVAYTYGLFTQNH
jgi:hypothetical protein